MATRPNTRLLIYGVHGLLFLLHQLSPLLFFFFTSCLEIRSLKITLLLVKRPLKFLDLVDGCLEDFSVALLIIVDLNYHALVHLCLNHSPLVCERTVVLIDSQRLLVNLIIDVGHPVSRHFQRNFFQLICIFLNLRRGVLLLTLVLHVVFSVFVCPHSQELCWSIFHAFEILLFGETHGSIFFVVSDTHSILLFAGIFGQSHCRFIVHVFWTIKSNVLIRTKLFLVIRIDLFILLVYIFINVLGRIIGFQRVKLMVEEFLLSEIFPNLFEALDLGRDSNMPWIVDNGGLVLDSFIDLTGLYLRRLYFFILLVGIFHLFLSFKFHHFFGTILLIVIVFDPERILILLLPFLFSELGNLFLLIGELFSKKVSIHLFIFWNRYLSISACRFTFVFIACIFSLLIEKAF